jgi:hypothetical protein
MSNTRVSLYADLLEGARKHTLQVAEGVPETHRFKQLQEGKATPLWLLGHMANTVNTLVLVYTLEEDSVLSREHSVLFAPDFVGGKTPTTNPERYPGWDEVLTIYNNVFDQALAGIRKLDDSVLSDPLPGKLDDQLRNFFSSIGATLSIMIQHDAYHRGQIGMMAKLD